MYGKNKTICSPYFAILWVHAHGDFYSWKDNIDVEKGHSILDHVQTANDKFID